MIQGFFSPSDLAKVGSPAVSLVPLCSPCGLYKTCQSPKIPPSGLGKFKVLLVDSAPSIEGDRKNQHLVGPAAEALRKVMRKLSLSLQTDCWVTSALICHPKGNATPTDEQIGFCRPNITRAIKELDPNVIVPLGLSAIKSVVAGLWREDVGSMRRWAGLKIPAHHPNAWICPTYSPTQILQDQNEVLELWWERHLEAAFDIKDKPWHGDPPNYEAQVKRLFEPSKAAKVIHSMIARGGTVAFDYETNMLKPDGQDAAIYCCSVCWQGQVTIAFPWQGEAVDAMSTLLKSPLGKIASNMKFEERWTRRFLGHGVRNWVWDTMQAAHILDSQPGVSSIKFQAFARLGFPVYDNHIKPYLIAKGSRAQNKIKLIDTRDLLLYCGLDSLLEYEVAKLQTADLGVNLGL